MSPAKTKSCLGCWRSPRLFSTKPDATFSEAKFTEFCLGFEEITPLEFHEIGALVPALKLVLLEEIAARAATLSDDPTTKSQRTQLPHAFGPWRMLAKLPGRTFWNGSSLSTRFCARIRRAPMPAMDVESRNVYREKVANIAQRSDRTRVGSGRGSAGSGAPGSQQSISRRAD